MTTRPKTDDIPPMVLSTVSTMLELRYDGPIPKDALPAALAAYRAKRAANPCPDCEGKGERPHQDLLGAHGYEADRVTPASRWVTCDTCQGDGINPTEDHAHG